ncbi:hypothetical protein BCR36DRAFT_586273 [Piromyces finnis]|uniref:Nucleotide exchange factor SIL1 n=1 Tax=Piromyces finnis TaxID=1754191 RepID=A0A1Y1UZS7_9FUNG|nr:hypothetical protein BCR36DRAFT_586273 [Piromyces finnis]|eukprot:ORX44141.1 hypothetical protein BCR36DRAFT_586273 [Piromyces finnis]
MFKIKNIILIALLTLCLSVGMVHCEFGKSLRYAKAPNGEDIICVYRFGVVENCYPRVFKATAEYQTILEGQEIPKGLDIQLSMRTGERRAKLSEATIQKQRVQQQLKEYLQQQQQQQNEQIQQKSQKQKQYDEYLQRKAQLQQYDEYLRYKAQQQRYDEYLQRRSQQQQFEKYLQQKAQQQQYEEYLQEQLQKQKYREYLQQQARKQQYQEYIKQQQQIEEQRYNEYIKQQQQLQRQKYDEYLQEQAKRQQQYEEYLRQLNSQPQLESLEEKQEEQQPHEIFMVKPEENENSKEEESKTEVKVQIHSGKYKSSESPSVESPENKKQFEGDDSDDSDDDSDDDKVVRINYEDNVSYTEAFSYLSKAKTLEEKIEVLEQLENIVHHIEFGHELMKSLSQFLNFLKDENPKVRALASICIGSSLQNNPKARKAAIKRNLYDILIERLTNEDDINVLKRLCYAFSNLVRGDTAMIKKLHESKNLGLLYHLYVNKPTLRSKLEIFVTDIFDPEKMKENVKLEEFVDKESAQLWCTVFQDSIISNEGYIPDSLTSLSLILENGQCLPVSKDLRQTLQDLPKTQPDLFEDALDLNDNIQKVLNYQGPQQSQSYKDEL